MHFLVWKGPEGSDIIEWEGTQFQCSLLRYLKENDFEYKLIEKVDAIEKLFSERNGVIQNLRIDNDDSIREKVLTALNLSNWRQNEAAKLLCISPRSMSYWCKKLGISHSKWLKRNLSDVNEVMDLVRNTG